MPLWGPKGSARDLQSPEVNENEAPSSRQLPNSQAPTVPNWDLFAMSEGDETHWGRTTGGAKHISHAW